MLCVLCLIVLWGFSLVTSYSGVRDIHIYIYSSDVTTFLYNFDILYPAHCAVPKHKTLSDHSSNHIVVKPEEHA